VSRSQKSVSSAIGNSYVDTQRLALHSRICCRDGQDSITKKGVSTRARISRAVMRIASRSYIVELAAESCQKNVRCIVELIAKCQSRSRCDEVGDWVAEGFGRAMMSMVLHLGSSCSWTSTIAKSQRRKSPVTLGGHISLKGHIHVTKNPH